MLIRRILELDAGFAITMASDGEAAWDLLIAMTEPIDVCLFDVMMPRLDGLSLVARMRADARFKTMPIVLCTTLNDRATVEKAISLSVINYVVKPYTRSNVIDKIHLAVASTVGVQGVEASGAACVRLGIDFDTYKVLAQGFVDDVLVWVRMASQKLGNPQLLVSRISGLKGSALSLGARALAAKFDVAESLLKRDGVDGITGAFLISVEENVRILQKYLGL